MNPNTPDSPDPLADWLQQRRAAFDAVDLSAAVMDAIRPGPLPRAAVAARSPWYPVGVGFLVGLLRTALLVAYFLHPA